MTCFLHPKYKGVRKPTVRCGLCYLVWHRHQHKRGL